MKQLFSNAPWWPYLLLCASCVLAFFPTFTNGFTHWDDHLQVTENPDILGLTVAHLKTIFSSSYVGMYQPLTTLLFAIEQSLFGLSATGYHTVSLLLHLLNSFLVLRLLQALGIKQLPALLGALLFAVHPMQAESVAWVSARSNLLYTFFYMLGLLSYLRYVQSLAMRPLLLTVLFFVLSLLSKSAAVTFPLALLLLDWWIKRPGKLHLLWEKTPLLVLSVVFGLVTLHFRAEMEHLSDLSHDFSFFERLLIPLHSLAAYPVRYLAPLQLSAFYPYPIADGSGLPIWYYLAPIAVLALGIFLLLQFKKRPALTLAALFFLLQIGPVLQFVPVGSQPSADRYIYLSGIGLLLLLLHPSGWIGKKIEQLQGVLRYVPFVLPALFALLSINQTRIWQSDLTLWNAVIERYDYAPVAWNNRGVVYKEQGKMKLALQDLNRAIQLKPIYADAYSNRGSVRSELNDSKGAIADFGQAIKYKPRHANAWFNRANEKVKVRDVEGAIADFKRSIELFPKADAYANLAFAHVLSNNMQAARINLEKAIQLDPLFAAAYFLRGKINIQEGKPQTGCADLQKAKQLGHPQAQQDLQRFCR